jgi:hypothetical protein
MKLCACASVSFGWRSGYPIAGCGWTIRAIAQMKPTNLTRDRDGHDHLGLARRRQPAVPVAQAQLRPPGDVADCLRQTFDSIERLAADPSLHAIGPGALDQHPAGMGIAGLW